ncbi:MAG: arylesterase [Candidatus Pacebacteria bacterium]|nr:arylesterase [Candidatus Paceibacterota bacterium]
MNLKQFLLFVLGGILLTGIVVGVLLFLKDSTTANTTTAKKQEKTITIAAFGDSLTAGYGVDLTESYPYLLERKLQEEDISARVINMGVSGETTSGGLERVSFVLEQNPDIILLGLGANDMLRSLPPSLVKSNLETIIVGLLQGNKKIILLGMKSVTTNGQTYRQEFDAIYSDLAKKYNLTLVPFFLEGVILRPTLNTNDGIHPNKSGYEKIVSENILPVLLPHLKKL